MFAQSMHKAVSCCGIPWRQPILMWRISSRLDPRDHQLTNPAWCVCDHSSRRVCEANHCRRLITFIVIYGQDNYATAYMNQDDVKQALHVESSITWSECSNSVKYNTSDSMVSMVPTYQFLLNGGYGLNILVYSGDDDSVCGTVGTQSWVRFEISITRRPQLVLSCSLSLVCIRLMICVSLRLLSLPWNSLEVNAHNDLFIPSFIHLFIHFVSFAHSSPFIEPDCRYGIWVTLLAPNGSPSTTTIKQLASWLSGPVKRFVDVLRACRREYFFAALTYVFHRFRGLFYSLCLRDQFDDPVGPSHSSWGRPWSTHLYSRCGSAPVQLVFEREFFILMRESAVRLIDSVTPAYQTQTHSRGGMMIR